MIKNFDELLKRVESKPNKIIAIAAAHSPSILEAAVLAKKEKIADCLLIGNETCILKYLEEYAPEMVIDFQIIDTGDDLQLAAQEAVKAVRDGKADILSKGKCETSILLKAVLDKNYGLRTGEILSDVLLYERPDRLVLMSDGGINLYPTLEEKVSIVRNAVRVARGLRCENPKVALLAAVEKVNKKMPCTINAAEIAKMNREGKITDCIIEGPLAFDIAISKKAAEIKGIKSEVAGNADVLIVPNIESGNIFGKTLTYYCNYRMAHLVMGAKAPILIASRSDGAETKMLTMALGVLST